MERWSPSIVARAHLNMTLNTTLSTLEASWSQSNRTRMLIDNLRLAQVHTLRTMHVTLGAFSLGLALLMVLQILHDARRVSSLQITLRPRIFDFLANIHPAETFPLVLASGIAIQEVIFVTVQSTALDSLIVAGCRGVAMVVFPAMFLQGYVNLVFGAETAIRSLGAKRFSPRGKWTTKICLMVVALMLLLTWIPTIIWQTPNHCFGSLVWYPIRYKLVAIIILCVMLFFFLALAAVISIQLMRSVKVDPNERIAASRMSYYLVVAAIIYALVLPFAIQAHRRDFNDSLASTTIAEVPLFSSGIFVAFIHLFLRVNASRMVIKPLGVPWQKYPRIRFFGPSDLEMNTSGPIFNRSDSQDGFVMAPEKERVGESLSRVDYYNRPEKESQDPRSPASSLPGSRGPPTHKRAKSSYSLFPTRAEEIPRLPATIYTLPSASNPTLAQKASSATNRQTRSSVGTNAASVTDVHEASLQWLNPPPPPFSIQRHRRDDSADSSATVQIGLRFSVAPAAIAAANRSALNRALTPPPPPLATLRRDPSDSNRESLGLPIQAPSSEISSIDLPKQTGNTPSPPQAPPSVILSPSKSTSQNEPGFPQLTPQNSGIYLQVVKNKVLPPTPRDSAVGRPNQLMAISGLRINPVSPAKKSPTSRPGVGLGAGTISRSPPPEGGWI